ncbi:hypothetical protein K4K53_009260 [Colletotrichum sp. SAR 10_77]|nr:hypothetical protein K4K53_009260 [Colletotrichum sp. SAR 10_77]
MEQGKAQNDAGPGTSTEHGFRYVAPRWFLDNIKTAEELKKAQARIWLVDEGTEAFEGSSVAEATPDEKFLSEAAGDGRDSYFTVGREVVEDLLDTATSLQMVNLAGRLSRTQSSITLSCEMRFGLQFLDELVIFMAKELDFSLVSINSQDLEDVGLDFYCQKKAFERTSESPWEEKLRQLRYKCNDFEKELLPSIINPNDLDAQLDNVVLDQDVMTSITTIIQQQQHQPDIGAASSGIMDLVKIRGILLYGPPGTGKTLLARVIAKSTGHNMIAVDPATITTCLVGTTEKRIRAAFTLAQKLFPCIIFIDELDSLFLRRTSNDRPFERASVIQFLQSMDGLVQNKRAPLVIGATNKPMDLDSAFLRRLPHKVSLGLPNAKARTRILLLLLEGVNLDHVNIDHLATVTEGFSGADLKTLCSQAALDWAVQNNMESGQPRSELEARLTDAHFSKAFEKNYYEVTDAWTNFPEKARKVIRWIDSQEPNGESSPYFWEKKLLPLLIDPQTIGACWSDLAIHPKTEQEIKEILNHHNNSCESTQSYGLLRGSHTGGALVYGPPGTEKNDVFSAEAWASPAFEIDCDGHAVSVATNLYTALVSIRGKFSERRFIKPIAEDQFRSNNADYSYIWIDALCINQDDLQEKANQIPLMNRIYSQARATIMWLGGEEPLIKKGVPETMEKLQLVVNRLRENIGPENEDLVIDWCRTFDIYDPEAYEVLGLEPIDLEDLIGWYLLFSRSWFKRAWVVQEWVLSPTCFFLCGTLTFSTEAFCSMFIDFSRRHWTLQIQKLVIANLLDPETMAIPHGLEQFNSDHRDFPLESKYRALALFRAKLDYSIFDELDESLLAVYILRDFFTDERSKTPPRDPSSQELWNIGMSIQLFRGRRCFNPRDKIYAFHGIFKNSDGMSIFPSPDYLKSVSEVYTEATRAIALDIGISFLHFREFRSSNPHGLPSWVPDYQVNDGFLKLDNPFTPTKHPSSFFKAASGLGTSTLTANRNYGFRLQTLIGNTAPDPGRVFDSNAAFRCLALFRRASDV